jgi:hypothetical protein
MQPNELNMQCNQNLFYLIPSIYEYHTGPLFCSTDNFCFFFFFQMSSFWNCFLVQAASTCFRKIVLSNSDISSHYTVNSTDYMWPFFRMFWRSGLSWVDVVTDGHSAYPSWCRAPLWGPWPDFSFSFLLPDNWFALRFGALSLTRGRVCNL